MNRRSLIKGLVRVAPIVLVAPPALEALGKSMVGWSRSLEPSPFEQQLYYQKKKWEWERKRRYETWLWGSSSVDSASYYPEELLWSIESG